MQWGHIGNNGTNINTIIFPISFKTKSYSIVASDWNNGTTGNVYAIGIDIMQRTVTSCKCISAPGSYRGVTWLAIGS